MVLPFKNGFQVKLIPQNERAFREETRVASLSIRVGRGGWGGDRFKYCDADLVLRPTPMQLLKSQIVNNRR